MSANIAPRRREGQGATGQFDVGYGAMTRALAVLLLLALAILLVGWLLRDPGRRKPTVVDGGRGFELAYSPVQKAVGWIVLALVTLACLATRPPDPRWHLAWALVTALVVLPLAAQAYGRRLRIQVLSAGLRAFSPWRPRVDLRWSEVQGLEWRPRRELLLVRGAGGRSIAVPVRLVGLGQLEDVLRSKLPASMLQEPLAALRRRLDARYGPRKPA